MCVREREKERKRATDRQTERERDCVCVCVSVYLCASLSVCGKGEKVKERLVVTECAYMCVDWSFDEHSVLIVPLRKVDTLYPESY